VQIFLDRGGKTPLSARVLLLMSAIPNTRYSLLGRLVAEDSAVREQAWQDFVDLYRVVILRWCRGHGLRTDQADDVLQEVLLKLFRSIGSYTKEKGLFRAYLRTVVRRESGDYLERLWQWSGCGRGGDLPADQPNPGRLEEALWKVVEANLQQAVWKRLARRFPPERLALAQRLLREPVSPVEVATQSRLKVTTVYKIKSKVVKAFEEEFERLQREGLDPGVG
jgi:RNA polymerase sigma factor (sigma-70 family)